MFSNLSIIFKKYSVPTLFFILGVLLFIAGIKGEQNTIFMISAVMMFLAGAMSLMYSSGSFKSILLYIFGGFAGVAAIVTLILSYNSVKETATYNSNYALCKGKSISNLEDIRFLQKAFHEKNGVYAKDWVTLIEFAKTGTVAYVESAGVVPNRKVTEAERDYLIRFGLYKKGQAIDFNMTDKEAYFLAKSPNCPEELKDFKRDTLQRSIMEMKFKNKAYAENRKKAGYGKFYADSIPYIPFTGGRKMWTIEAKDSIQIGEDFVQALRVSGKIPFAKIQGTADEELFFGTLTGPDLIGNWEEN